MAAKYEDGSRIAVGDLILYGSKPGKVVFAIEDGLFAAGFRKEDWDYRRKGIGLQLENGEMFCLDDADEDLLLIQRSLPDSK